MNIFLILAHLLLTTYAPTSTTTSDDGNTSDTGNVEPGTVKGGKYDNGDYIIWNEIMP